MADESPDPTTRRALLRTTAALGAGLALAGCSQSEGTPTPDPVTAAPLPGTPTEEPETPTEVTGEGDLLGAWPSARRGTLNHGRSADVGPEVDPTAHWRATVDLRTTLRAAVGPDGPVVTREDGLVRAYTPDGTVRWETDHDDVFVAAPVVAEDGTVVLPGLDGTVRCLAPDGAERWSVATPEGLFAPHSNDATPLRITGDTVLVAHPRGQVYALALADGTERWTTETFRRPHRPAAADGAVFVTGDERDRNGGVTLACSLADGTERWRETEPGSVHVGPGFHEGSVVTADIDGGVVAREPDDGRERWRVTLPEEPWVSTVPQSFGGRVWLGTLDERLFVVDDDGGVERFDVTVDTTPAVGDDALYVASGRDGVVGRYRSEVVALDDEGHERWRRTVRGPPEGHLRYRDGRVTFGTATGVAESIDAGGERVFRSFARHETLPEPVVGPRGVYCGGYGSHVSGFTIRNGRSHLWGQGLDGAAPETPAVTDRGVLSRSRGGELALTGRLPAEVVDPPSSRLTVTPTPDPEASPTPHVDYPKPEARWRRELGGPVGSVAVSRGSTFVGVGTRVVSLDSSGEVRWRTDFGEPVRAVPAAAGPGVYASTTEGGLVALNRDDGSERWATRVGQRATAPVVLGEGGPVLVGTDRGLVSVDGEGTVQWRVGNERVYGAPAFGGTAVFADARGVVRSVSRAGEVNWRVELGASVRGAPAMGRDRVYVGTRHGTLYALSKRDGTPAWHYDVGEWVDGSPVLAHGAVFVVDAAGGLTCVVGE